MMDTTYNVGIYCRLSNDDERDGESVSIENQKLLLQNYVRQRGWNEVDVYIDDGYSGTNFNRPGVRRLIEDAKAKRINVILVKDLSRFGRNYIEFGQYTDYLSVITSRKQPSWRRAFSASIRVMYLLCRIFSCQAAMRGKRTCPFNCRKRADKNRAQMIAASSAP